MTSGKISDKLASLIQEESPDKAVRLNVMLARGTPQPAARSAAHDLGKFAGASEHPQVLAAMGMVNLNTRLGSVRQIAELASVEWVDVDGTAPIESLMDDGGGGDADQPAGKPRRRGRH